MNPIDRNDAAKAPNKDSNAFAIDEDVVLPPVQAPKGRPPLRSALLRPEEADDCVRFNQVLRLR